ncbi:hypothetical protein P3T73_00580 [Kiritimatiellota bacterium B12222]|nr:hypothetical protein P3T73_00580 [Kiritimatiellota bacterium B12222]
MMTFCFPRFFLCLSCLMLPLISGVAVEGGSGVHVRLLSWSEEPLQELYLQTDEDVFVPLSLRSNRRSTGYELYDSGVLRIYTDAVDAEGNAMKIPVLQTPISSDIREPLVILFSSMVEGKPTYRATVMEDAESAFPFGSYRVINLSGYPLAFDLDGNAHRLESRASTLVQPQAQERENIAVQFYVIEAGTPVLVRQTYWRHQPTQRMLIFVMPSQNPQHSDYILYTISEREAVYRRLHETNRETKNAK